MKTKTQILGIEHDDLINLFSTAMYGSNFLCADYDEDEYAKLSNADEEDCEEDCIAKMLLAGKSVVVSDFYSEEEKYGTLPTKWDEEHQCMDYTITLKDIWNGFQAALDGTFKGDEEEKKWAHKVMSEILAGDEGDYDQADAEMIMQIIIFGERIYC